MDLEYHPSYDSIEAYLHAPSFSPVIEDHLLVCGVCQKVAEDELALAFLIRRSLVVNDPTLCRRKRDRQSSSVQ